ncbi:hypothetical protein AX15_000208 [Amanita polypyramis BW_CC]|nr:hypothetical protein AX15_000208 [Amanita polypyramis BW_CC]
MGRWSQHEEDTHRLPEGLVRVAYDTDTNQYTFRDTRTGKLYRSPPGEAYGKLYPVPEYCSSRPNAFAPEGHARSPSKAQSPLTTFHDILPAHAITTSPIKCSPPSNPGSRFPTPVPTHLRIQSTRVPSSSSNEKNVLHSRSRSVPNESVRNRNQHAGSPRYHTQHQSHQNVLEVNSRQKHHVASPSISKGVGKSGFSFSSALQNLSRAFTTVHVRDRTPQAISVQHRSGNDMVKSYR